MTFVMQHHLPDFLFYQSNHLLKFLKVLSNLAGNLWMLPVSQLTHRLKLLNPKFLLTYLWTPQKFLWAVGLQLRYHFCWHLHHRGRRRLHPGGLQWLPEVQRLIARGSKLQKPRAQHLCLRPLTFHDRCQQ